MDDSMVFFFNYCFRKVINRFGLYCYLGFLGLVLTGCPTQFEKFEQYYFQDRFIDAVILMHDQDMSFDFSQKLNDFLVRNRTRLNKNLLAEINQFDASISAEDVDRLHDLLKAFDYLQVTFPNVMLDYKQLIDVVHYVMDGYVAKKQFDINYLLNYQRYRQTRSSLFLLQNQQSLTSTQNQLLIDLDDYLKRYLFIEPIRIHDNDIADFKNEKVVDHYANYLKKGRSLLEYSIDIPVEFERHLDHHLLKEKSDYLFSYNNINTQVSFHYRLVCSVGVGKDKSFIEKRQEIEDKFLIKFDFQADWQQEDVMYEIFVSTTMYRASVDAAVYLGDTDEVLGHYIYEVTFPVDSVRVGDFLYLPDNIVEMTYSQQYKTYRDTQVIKDQSYYFQHVLDDAAQVLVIKLLNTIDRDPDPYSVRYPF